MILGIDLYGTLTSYPVRLKELAYSVIDAGGSVVVISAVKEGNESRAISTALRYLPEATVKTVVYDNYGMVPKLKYDACVELGVTLYIDDRKDTVNYLNKRKILSLLVPK